MNQTGDILLEARGISKSFPGVKALDEVSLTLRAGRLRALLGENGAGKSTLMNIIAGVFPPDAGRLRVEGREVRFGNTRAAHEAGISMIFQEMNLIPHLTVAENIFLGREPRTGLGLLDTAAMNRSAAALLARLDLRVSPDTPVESLRVGQQQIVEIARALSGEARVVIMDEPTSALSQREIDVLHGIIGGLKRQGVALAYITHKLEELERIGDDATVMRDGKVVAAAPLKDLSRDQIVRWMIGRDVGALEARTPPAPGREALQVRGLSLRHPDRVGDFLLRDIEFSVRDGEVLGVFGLMGAGRTELLETLFGLHSESATGEILIGGEAAVIRSPASAIAQGVALAPEDRKREGLVLEMSVAENTSLASLAQVTRFGLIEERAESRHVRRYLGERRRHEVEPPARQ